VDGTTRVSPSGLFPYIAFEGIDGAGKSTMAAAVARELGAMLVTEPTREPVGALIRQCLAGKVSLSEYQMVLLFAADRAGQLPLVEQEIRRRPVVSDRSMCSSLVYQTEVLDLSIVERANADFAPPRFIVYLRSTPTSALVRLRTRGFLAEKYETEEFLRDALGRYEVALDVMRRRGSVVYEIDANRSLDEVERDCLALCRALVAGEVFTSETVTQRPSMDERKASRMRVRPPQVRRPRRPRPHRT
jgi:dTMP kinase